MYDHETTDAAAVFEAALRKADVSAIRAGQIPGDLVMFDDAKLTVMYAPFDHIADAAEIAIVGLTPGRAQAVNSIEAYQAAIRGGYARATALAEAKRTASFSGPMRANLLAMLDHLEIPQRFGRSRASEFFEPKEERAHFTSTLRYPVFVNGRNYSGAPAPQKTPALSAMIDVYLRTEVKRLANAVWIPLGTHAEAAMLQMASDGTIERNRVLSGLPHPSGANAERIAYFLGRKPKEQLSSKTNAASLDHALSRLREQVASL